MITSPYNFVPLSEKVVSPFWAKHVSHDIPFENGVSGVLKLKITAKSPIYVRNGVFGKDKDDENEKNRFNHFNNKPFIPASSIKGMLRSVVEIMSFGRMANKVNDVRYSVRDFENKQIYPKEKFSKDILCGWLYYQNGEFFLVDCGRPARISHQKLQDQFNNGMSDFFKDKNNLKSEDSKSAKFKYSEFEFERTGRFSTFIDSVNRTQCFFDDDGKTGTIVMTGQPGERREPKGKHLEFVFFASKNQPKSVSDQVIKNFFFAYYDHDINQQKDDWEWRKPQLMNGEPIPVFFRKNSDGSIKDMGLSFLYKITYEQSIIESINNTQKNNPSYDLAETIFGYTEGDNALKGRVHISHAFLKNKIDPLKIKLEVLSGPKASYYPNYIEQNNTNGIIQGSYSTFMNPNSKIRGWKRYPVRFNGTISNIGSTNVVTPFIPLDARNEFAFDIRYHNLRTEELGALISAITYHNTEGLYHSLGMAKPLGYGKISLSIENLEESEKVKYLKAYETFMDCELNRNESWFQSVQIKELFAMSKGSTGADIDKELKYMTLDVKNRNLNGFVNAKKNNNTLKRFSEIVNTPVNIISLVTQEDIAEAKIKFDKEKTALAAKQNKDGLKQATKSQHEEALKRRFEEKKLALISLLETKRQAQKEIEIAEELRKKQELEEEQKRKKQERSEMGSQTDLLFSNFDYEKVADVVKNHLKKYKVEELTETQKGQLMAALTTSYQSIKNPKKDVWLKKDNKFNQFPWTDIRKWLGDDQAQALHRELVG